MRWPWTRPALITRSAEPVVPHLAAVLHAVAREPRTPGELARDLGSTPEALEGMLQTLHAGGYVQQAAPDGELCACGPCALKSLCRNAETGQTPPLHLLRLTPRGEVYLARMRPHGP